MIVFTGRRLRVRQRHTGNCCTEHDHDAKQSQLLRKPEHRKSGCCSCYTADSFPARREGSNEHTYDPPRRMATRTLFLRTLLPRHLCAIPVHHLDLARNTRLLLLSLVYEAATVAGDNILIKGTVLAGVIITHTSEFP